MLLARALQSHLPHKHIQTHAHVQKLLYKQTSPKHHTLASYVYRELDSIDQRLECSTARSLTDKTNTLTKRHVLSENAEHFRSTALESLWNPFDSHGGCG